MSQAFKIVLILISFSVITWFANKNTKDSLREELDRLSSSREDSLLILQERFEYQDDKINSLGAHTTKRIPPKLATTRP